MPKVSILVPIYNVEKYLRECLDSLISQTLKDIEIICINDGSTDSSKQIIEEYRLKDPRIVVINKANTGYGNSMNRGLAIAKGKYIGILESDDFAAIDMYKNLFNLAEKNNADVVKSDWYCYWTEKKEARKSGQIKLKYTNKIINAHEDKSILKIQPSIWSSLYRKEFLEKNKINFLETPGASYQDTAFNYKVFILAKRVVFTNKAYVYYRQDNINSSVKSKNKVYAICNEYDEVEHFLRKDLKLFNEYSEFVYAIQYRAYFGTMLRIDKTFVKKFIQTFSEKFKDLDKQKLLNKYFYSRNKRSEVMTLINNQEEFFKIYQKSATKNKNKLLRRKILSIRINSSRISIVFLGKEIFKYEN